MLQIPGIQPEFAALREYFIRALKKKLITANISILYSGSEIISTAAKSEDIDCINNQMIDSIRFELVKREVLKAKELPLEDKALHTIEEFFETNRDKKS